MSSPLISTPCVQLCVVDPRAGLCIGCGRTLDEIANWSRYDEPQRAHIMRGLERRLAKARTRSARGRNRLRPDEEISA